jgi:hypothetical protein
MERQELEGNPEGNFEFRRGVNAHVLFDAGMLLKDLLLSGRYVSTGEENERQSTGN